MAVANNRTLYCAIITKNTKKNVSNDGLHYAIYCTPWSIVDGAFPFNDLFSLDLFTRSVH